MERKCYWLGRPIVYFFLPTGAQTATPLHSIIAPAVEGSLLLFQTCVVFAMFLLRCRFCCFQAFAAVDVLEILLLFSSLLLIVFLMLLVLLLYILFCWHSYTDDGIPAFAVFTVVAGIFAVVGITAVATSAAVAWVTAFDGVSAVEYIVTGSRLYL
jgi:hypothetical protein